MKKSENKLWKPISIGSQFELHRGRESKSTVEEGGKIPFVSAKKCDNGYRMFVKKSNTKISGNTLSLNNNGDGGAGFGYYQPYEYTVDVNTTALVPHQGTPMNKHIGLFWISCFTWMHDFFGNARTLSNKRAKTTKILLPVTDNGTPDYEYMTAYTDQKLKTMQKRYRAYVEKHIGELGKQVKILALNEIKWDSFYISQIFTDIGRGKRLKKANHLQGAIPYVSSTALNNGVDGFIVASSGTRVFGNCISLANSGSVGTAFYEPFDFVASDHVTHLKRDDFNKWIYLFLTVTVEKQGVNFNFNREINDVRIKKMKIMLPINSDGQPDFAYMEQYAKNMMLKKYKQYLAFLDSKEKADETEQ